MAKNYLLFISIALIAPFASGMDEVKDWASVEFSRANISPSIQETLVIRLFNPTEDVEAVHQIILRNLKDVNSTVYPDSVIEYVINRYSIEKINDMAHEPNQIILIAELNSHISGVAGLFGNEIRMVFVEEKMHGTGIGRALIQAIENIAKERNFLELTLSSTINAEAFYRRLGFVGGEVKQTDGGTLIEMSKRL